MSLFDAKEYDPRPAQRRKRLVLFGVVALLVILVFWWMFRYWPEEHTVNKFFEAIEAKQFETAYGIYFADPDWKQHPAKYPNYTFNQFLLDWGPSGEFGIINSHHIDCAAEPPKKGFSSPSGVIVVTTINNRQDAKGKSQLWVEKKDKTISPSYLEVDCQIGSRPSP